MQETRRRFSWREILMLMIVPLLLFVLGLSLFQQETPKTSYQRYLSDPLPDGTRYTFRYPTWFDWVGSGGDGTSVRLRHDETTTVRAKMLLAAGLQPPVEYMFITAYTMPVSGKPTVSGGGKLLAHPNRQSSITYNRSSTNSQTVITPPGKLQYILQYNESAAASQRFQEWGAVIMPSFQVLPPGATVPAP